MRLPFYTVFFIVSSLFMQTAYAEDGCPEGMQPYQPQQGFGAPNWSCMPIPGYSNGSNSDGATPPPPPKPWHNRYGGIAIDGSHGIIGISSNQSERDLARSLAISDCKNKGGSNCKLVGTYRDGCAVFVAGDKLSAMNSDGTIEKAQASAMGRCQKVDTNCEVLYSGCSLPVQY
jgi:hypothetical protein